jgi:hypothetical protein
MKIHISENTKLLLDHVGGFKLEKRGNIEIKVSVPHSEGETFQSENFREKD